MLDYDKEAARYDATRGGEARAEAAAAAIVSLLPASARTVVDAACGTGIVTVRLAAGGRTVLGVDKSAGMAAVAARRLPGRIAVGDATRLPLASGSADAVTMVWLLHLLSWEASARAIAEAARVLRPGGVLITTVDKNAASYHDADDASTLADRTRALSRTPQPDAAGRVAGLGASHQLTPSGRTTFTGLGQGLSPREWRQRLQTGHLPWTKSTAEERMAALYAALAALPDQDRARQDPVYPLVALAKRG